MSRSTTTTTTTTPPQEFMVVADIGEWKTQLITKEDPYHIHKTLGILCLCSFVWRYAHVGSSDMGFLSHPQYTIPTLCLHFLLTASAFEFKIPNRRIKDGTRIWPEYRMHAMVFLCRSLLVIGMYWYEEENDMPRWYDFNFFVVIASMVAADLCSASVGKENQSNSIRDIDTHPAVKYFFSVVQFFATSGYLMGWRRYSFPFLAVMIVQLTPFLGTLRRKNLIGRNLGTFLYGVFLVSSYVISMFYAPGGSLTAIRTTGFFGLIAATWRLMPLPSSVRILQNKYFIWITIGLMMRHSRSYLFTISPDDMIVPFRVAVAMVAALGYYKIYFGYSNSKGIVSTSDKKLV
jgi:hypothetical protein